MKKKVVFLLATALALAGCGQQGAEEKTPATDFETMTVSKQDITLEQSYPAQIEGRQSVKIIPRVEGYLRQICVKEGQRVKKGQVLFVIDQASYQAEVKAAEANVAVAKAGVETAQLDVTRENISNAQHTVEVMQTLKEVGMQNEAAVSAARATWLNVAAQEKTLLQQIQAMENSIRVLVGKQLESIGRTGFGNAGVSVNDSTTYQLATLANRPDVKAAEYALKTQMAQADVARAAFYPQLNITASAGWTNNVGEIVNPGQMLFSAIGSLVQPLFNKGQNRANLRIAKARQEQALIAFNQALLVAGTELSDALTTCRLSSERLALRQQEVAAAEHAYEVSKDVMQNSSSTYLEVLTAQQSLLQSRLSLTTDRFDLIQGKINLFKALGGEIEN